MTSAARAHPQGSEDLPVLDSLAELAGHVTADTHLRFSRGPAADRGARSRDYESGLELSGLSVNPLHPEPWWRRPVEDWLARQICNYVHLMEESDDDRQPWVLRGDVVARGPDNEPLVAGFEAVALLSEALVAEARRRYAERFDVANDST